MTLGAACEIVEVYIRVVRLLVAAGEVMILEAQGKLRLIGHVIHHAGADSTEILMHVSAAS